MADFRIRVELFKGQKAIELSRLAALPDELTRLFKSIADDAGVLPMDNRWSASNFSDGSLAFDANCPEDVGKKLVSRCQRIAHAVFAGDAVKAYEAGVTDKTLLQYQQVAKNIRAGETVCLGVFRPRSGKTHPKLFAVTSERVDQLTREINPIAEYHGTVLGFVHALFLGAERPHFDLRDISREGIVKCYYRRDQHGNVVSALTPHERRVHVSGLVRADRLTKTINTVNVEKMDFIDPPSDDVLEQFFGCAPNMTGGPS